MNSKIEQKSVLKSAGIMGVATFLSRIMGLVREQVFAILFGASNAMDAFNVAFRIPNLLRDLFAEGAMSAALVPTFTRVRHEEGERRGWRVAGLVFRTVFAVVCVIALLGMIFAPEIVGLYASAFKSNPEKFNLTVLLTRVMFPFFPLVALAAAFMGILNACGYFFIPAFSSALFNVGSILIGTSAALYLMRFPSGIDPIMGMAIGVVVGGMVQAMCQLPSLRKAGYRFPQRAANESTWSQDPALRRMLLMILPGMVGLAATQVNLLVNTILATSQGTGAVSWLNYAFRLMQFPIGIFGVSLAQATLPRVSRLWVEKKHAATAEVIESSLRQVIGINLLASSGLVFLGEPIISMIYQYGRFSATDATQTANALAAYSVGLTAYSVVKVLVPVCYAFGNTRIPVISSVLSVLMTIVLNLIFVKSMGFWGLALGTSLAAIFNSVFLAVAIQKMLRVNHTRLAVGPILRSLGLYLAVAFAMGLLSRGVWSFSSVFLLKNVISHLASESTFLIALARLASVGIAIVASAGFVLLMGRMLRLTEVIQVEEIFKRKFQKKK